MGSVRNKNSGLIGLINHKKLIEIGIEDSEKLAQRIKNLPAYYSDRAADIEGRKKKPKKKRE